MHIYIHNLYICNLHLGEQRKYYQHQDSVTQVSKLGMSV